ncbi:MAG: DUF2911 domain-containing protein [Ignavibacteriales bacterium]|nr:MAG: DUF2911 domain-containing protein [Ignavibacteriales bacterium]
MRYFFKSVFYVFLLMFLVTSIETFSQPQLTLPDASQSATVSQRIGLTDISITYNRPGVKGRNVFGELVPYDQVWRAGANKNTTVSFSTDIMVEGKKLSAGTYGLHMIPSKNEWTIIFSKNNWSWGSFNYDEGEDALRVKIKPQSGEFTEWLQYTFESADPNSTIIALNWDKTKAGFKVEVDVKTQVLASFRKQFDDLPGFFWQPWNQAANYCLQNKFNLDEALTWADRSIGINRTTQNQVTKIMLLEELGRKSEADQLKGTAFENATEADVNAAGYQFLFAGKIDDAINVFKMNTENHPDSWNVWDSLAEGYMNKGDKDLATKFYNKALGMAPENQKARINQLLGQLKM